MRCALESAARQEPLVGTASTVRALLAVQQEGSWGPDALVDSALPRVVATWLVAGARHHGVRPLLVRRHGRAHGTGTRVLAAWADPDQPWLETAVLDDVHEVTALDLAALGRGGTVGLERTDRPAFLVCTHGSHDPCCAVEGRPVAAALGRSHPESTWECSHVGGDRFAGNVLVLPDGLYYGRVDAATAPDLADLHLAGRVDLARLRGRSGHPFAVQAAEHLLRTRLDLHGLRDVTLVTRTRAGDGDTVATFATAEGPWRVVVRTTRGPAEQLTCRSPHPRRPLVTSLVSLAPVPEPS